MCSMLEKMQNIETFALFMKLRVGNGELVRAHTRFYISRRNTVLWVVGRRDA